MRISSNEMKEWLKVYFIMGSVNCERDPREILSEGIEGGLSLFQFREKGAGAMNGQEKLQLAQDLQAICRAHRIPFIVNDDIDLALVLDADGVHVGQEDEPVKNVREKLGDHKILGVSAHTVEEAKSAIEQGADYLGIGPIYPTTTKADAKEAQGMRLILALRNSGIEIPIVGIGGIKIDNASEVVAAGADGVSVITAISHAESPIQSARGLKRAVESVTR